MKQIRFVLFFLLLGICSVTLRFYNLNWDLGNYFHPDERNIAMAVSRIHFFSHMNPEFFAYGGLPVYLYRFIGEILTLLTHDNSWTMGWDKINLIGRYVSAFFSTVTLIPLFFLAKKIFGEKVALLSCFFYAIAVFSIQMAHYGVTESMITFFAVCIALVTLQLYSQPSAKMSMTLGILCGLALSAKTSSVSFFLYPFLCFFLFSISFLKKSPLVTWRKLFLYIFLFGMFAGGMFILFSPYTFLSLDKFLESMRYESGVVWGTLPVPYTRQFTGTIPYVYQLSNFTWQLGILTLFLLLSPFFLWKTRKEHTPSLYLFLAFPLFYFIYVGSWYTKFIRYMVPILPFFIILASYSLERIIVISKGWGKWIYLLVSIIAIGWTLAFMHIYASPQTRVVASTWIYTNVPPNSRLLTEHWDDGLPINLPFGTPGQYQIEQVALYDMHTPEEVKKLIIQLEKSDYIIINSRRLYGTLSHLPKEYPYVSTYYSLLFAEKLGYEKVKEFSSYPQIFGLSINDDMSEETFQVYDHPKVLIFKNTKRLNSMQLEQELVR